MDKDEFKTESKNKIIQWRIKPHKKKIAASVDNIIRIKKYYYVLFNVPHFYYIIFFLTKAEEREEESNVGYSKLNKTCRSQLLSCGINCL